MNFIMVDGHDTDAAKTEFVLKLIADTMMVFKKERKLVPIRFGVYGYDSDPRPLYQIPEIRAWSKGLYSRMPSIFLYLHHATVQWFFLSVADIEIIQVEQKQPSGLLAEYYAKLNPEEQKALRKQHPSSFLSTKIRLAASASSLIKELFVNGIEAIRNITSSEEEFNYIAREFTERLKLGLPTI